MLSGIFDRKAFWAGTLAWVVCFVALAAGGTAQMLSLPSRPANAKTGAQVKDMLVPLDLTARENAIFDEVVSGNVPNFLRTLKPVSVTENIGGANRTAVYYVTPEYVALGSDDDYFLMPMTPLLAQRLADRLSCNLPTRKMVNDIWNAAAVKLSPSPIPPSAQMTTVPVFWDHNVTVSGQRAVTLADRPLGALVGGHKKDVVVTARIATQPGRVAIYGWHYTSGTPIQPLSLVHEDTYADYSHGIRLVRQLMTVDGTPTTVKDVLADAALNALLSDEGVITTYRYPVPQEPAPGVNLVTNGSFEQGFTSGVGTGWQKWQAPSSNTITFGQASVNRHDGSYSQYWSRNNVDPFDGGLYQVVAVETGKTYKITAWIKRQSTMDGTVMQFGYDLGGGTDALAASVVYKDLLGTQDNVWVKYEEAVKATGATLTLFARGGHTGTTGGANCYFYLDEVSLVQASMGNEWKLR